MDDEKECCLSGRFKVIVMVDYCVDEVFVDLGFDLISFDLFWVGCVIVGYMGDEWGIFELCVGMELFFILIDWIM